MAWTNITNAQLAIGAPVRSIDLLALRDNITAQANGDAGAPKQQAAGINFNTNGLQNLSGALAIACPGANTVGSYATVGAFGYTASGTYVTWTVTFGSNYAAGGGNGQLRAASIGSQSNNDPPSGVAIPQTTSLSGTWKWLGATTTIAEAYNFAGAYTAVGCRVA